MDASAELFLTSCLVFRGDLTVRQTRKNAKQKLPKFKDFIS